MTFAIPPLRAHPSVSLGVPASPAAATASADPDCPRPAAPVDRLARWARDPAGTVLDATAARAAAIARGDADVRVVDGRRLAFPSQRLDRIESRHPDEPGQTHVLARHVGTTLRENLARLAAEPLIRAAGSYTSIDTAQRATDETIANPANQAAIGAFAHDAARTKLVLSRIDCGAPVGASTLRSDVAAGTPRLVPSATATVVLIKDPTFPEGYRVLTSYPDTRPPEVDARGCPLP